MQNLSTGYFPHHKRKRLEKSNNMKIIKNTVFALSILGLPFEPVLQKFSYLYHHDIHTHITLRATLGTLSTAALYAILK
jgi:hypothetical protein